MNLKHIMLICDKECEEYLTLNLLSLGFKNISIFNSLKTAMKQVDLALPDLIISNFNLENGLSINDMYSDVHCIKGIPIIIIDSVYSQEILDGFANSNIVNYISIESSQFELNKVMKLAFLGTQSTRVNKIKEFVFVRKGAVIEKVLLSDVEYISVDGKYVELHTRRGKYIMRSSLNAYMEKLPKNFLKIHQAYAINLSFLTKLSAKKNFLYLSDTEIPFSRGQRKVILNSAFA